MTKTILKETGIVLLMIIAIGLVLAIVFYDYIPNDKVVPIKIQSYNLSEDVKNEIKGATLEEQNIVRTYYIDSSDLTLYEATNEYDKGKANPFADYSASSNTSTNTSTSNKTTTNGTTTSTTKENSTDTENEVYMTTPGKNY